MGCDTLVALAPTTQAGTTVFAKNSDRPPRECQRVVQLPRRHHPAGSRLRCQYLEIPQVAETASVIGTQPYWLWGLEQGVNEHRVAIGNETVFAREPLGAVGLTGMDLVRLGLERARSADEALTLITDCLEAHGQGGSGHAHLDWPYHNAFLISDPTAAWILETSDRHWAARPVDGTGNVSNGLAIGTDWTRGSADLAEFAVAQGWWPAGSGRLDFTRAYGDDSAVPPNLCRERRSRAAALLTAARGRITPPLMRTFLRDHYDAGLVHRPRPVDDPHYFSLCMHADPLDNTTASMVVELPSDPHALPAARICLGSPCVGAFLPCYLDATVPSSLTRGGEVPEAQSSWWRMRELLTLVEQDFARLGPMVRARWDAFEETVEREARAVEDEAAAARRAGRSEAAAVALSAFMARTVAAHASCAETLIAECGGSAPAPRRVAQP